MYLFLVSGPDELCLINFCVTGILSFNSLIAANILLSSKMVYKITVMEFYSLSKLDAIDPSQPAIILHTGLLAGLVFLKPFWHKEHFLIWGLN